MYVDYFGLNELPFSLVSDPKFLYLSEDHHRVRAYIEYAMRVQDSFVICTGEIGSGKTTLVNDALTRQQPHSIIARIQATCLSSEEFAQMLLLEFGIEPYQFSKVQLMEELKQFLHAQNRQGKKIFLFVDEAQNLSKTVLEDIRYLSDMEVNQNKLMSVLLVGQPELNETLDQPDMEHLLQRIRLRFHINALKVEDIAAYINHRLLVAGLDNDELFDAACITTIHQYTGGRLRLINTLCDYALMYACVEKLEHVNEWVIQKAANELQWEPYEKRFGKQIGTAHVSNEQPDKNQSHPSKLIMRHNSKIQGEFKLDKAYISIGRQMENDIPIDDNKVSRNHARVILQGGQVYIEDLSSTNGTFLENAKINIHQLQNGEEFSIGDYFFTFVDEVAPRSDSVTEEDVQEVHSEESDDRTRIMQKLPSLSLVNN